MGYTTTVFERKFLGKLTDFTSKEEQRFNQKMLKAYLQGNDRFAFGKNKQTGLPRYHNVKQEVTYLGLK